MYRNPYTDDPSVCGKFRGTQNTQVWYHNGRILAMKEDTMPAALDPHTLETLDGNYKFDGKIKSQTFTAHPKNDSHTGNLLAFGYEATGLGSTDICVFEIDPQGKTIWQAMVKAPYCSEIHDYAITEKHIVFLVYPLAYLGEDLMQKGGVHWGWDSTRDTYLGVMRRHGDGKDIQWLKGPQTMCTHTMGCWTDGDMVYVDMDGGLGNQFPFFPSPNPNDRFDPREGHRPRAPLHGRYLARRTRVPSASRRCIAEVTGGAGAAGRSLPHRAVPLRLPDGRRAGQERLDAHRPPDRQGRRVQPGSGLARSARCASCRAARVRPRAMAIWSACVRVSRRTAVRTC